MIPAIRLEDPLTKIDLKCHNTKFLYKDQFRVSYKKIMIHTMNSLSRVPLFFLFDKSSMNLFLDTLCDVKLLYSTLMTSSSMSSGSSSTISTRSDSYVEIPLLNSMIIPLSSTFPLIGISFFLLKYLLL